MRVLPAAIVMLIVVAGCSLGGEDSKSTIEVDQLKSVVLQPKDLPPVFVRFDEGRQVRADQPAGARSDPRRFGRQEGWKARYRRPGSPQTKGALVIESRADLYESAGGAKDDLEAAESELTSSGTTPWRPVEAPRLGDESFAMTVRQPGFGGGVRFYVIAWREDNLTAAIQANGFEGKFTLAEALSLARNQQARIADERE